MLETLPPRFVPTREALRALACYVVAPARKAATGRIGLRPTGDGFGTPPFDDGTRIVVRGDELLREPGGGIEITTLRTAAAFLGVGLAPDPGVGHDLPPFEPDAPLDVDAGASFALGAWYAFGQALLDDLPGLGSVVTVSEAQLWPEHFDLAVIVGVDGGRMVNIGASAGDGWSDDPYVYLGPHDVTGLDDPFWNAPFGATIAHRALRTAADPVAAALELVETGLALLDWA